MFVITKSGQYSGRSSSLSSIVKRGEHEEGEGVSSVELEKTWTGRRLRCFCATVVL